MQLRSEGLFDSPVTLSRARTEVGEGGEHHSMTRLDRIVGGSRRDQRANGISREVGVMRALFDATGDPVRHRQRGCVAGGTEPETSVRENRTTQRLMKKKRHAQVRH